MKHYESSPKPNPDSDGGDRLAPLRGLAPTESFGAVRAWLERLDRVRRTESRSVVPHATGRPRPTVRAAVGGGLLIAACTLPVPYEARVGTLITGQVPGNAMLLEVGRLLDLPWVVANQVSYWPDPQGGGTVRFAIAVPEAGDSSASEQRSRDVALVAADVETERVSAKLRQPALAFLLRGVGVRWAVLEPPITERERAAAWRDHIDRAMARQGR